MGANVAWHARSISIKQDDAPPALRQIVYLSCSMTNTHLINTQEIYVENRMDFQVVFFLVVIMRFFGSTKKKGQLHTTERIANRL